MSRMLTLIDAGWTTLAKLATGPQRTLALPRLLRFLSRPDLPADLAAEAHRLAGELLLEVESFAAARRHLRAAIRSRPDARTFYLLGLAWERDPRGCDRRAARAFRRAWMRERREGRYRAAFGRAAVRCGDTARGLRALRAAYTAAPGDPAVLDLVVDGLLTAGRTSTARRLLTTARFRYPGCGQLTALLNRVKFESARLQQAHGRATRHRQDAEHATDGGRVALPFVRLQQPAESDVVVHRFGHGTRRDVVSFPRTRWPRLRLRRADR